ncbi:polysaccharide biosynthesis/export family protein [Stieleria sp. TO1_6]|uniref:polysaccharide biosynthesis/export family protein n=1 Tax=Stieleria tagensis TaxID=2956795 RepID=UPI00209B052A|nr:polysaccharide biosynthesis/export family protein [Stieleria tagensis]MCO8125209.1 polysaccharide biosynthesis/export family protein [Stieleria tagensis]
MRKLFAMLAMIGASGSLNALADENYTEFLRQAETIAEQYRDDSADSEQKADQQSEIRSLVTKSFDVRQTSQRKQLEQMREQLQKAEAALDARQTIRDRIIARKVEDLLSGQPADWKAATEKNEHAFDVIGMGDTVAIYLEGVVPYNRPNQPPTPPQVNLLKSGRLVTGYPFAVGSDGAISMPLIDLIEIAGLTVREAERKISQAYIEADILRPERARPTLTLIPKEEAKFSAIGATDVSIAAREPEAAAVTMNLPVFAGSANAGSFEDTYGRLNKARELAEEIRFKQKTIEDYRRQLEKGVSEIQKPQYNRVIPDLEKKVATARFRLELERDYIADVLKRLDTELQAQQLLVQQAQQDYNLTEELFLTGAVTPSSRSQSRSKLDQKKAELQMAEQKASQFKKISERWKTIVGDSLDANVQSKERVDERGGR